MKNVSHNIIFTYKVFEINKPNWKKEIEKQKK